jgi:hypothetical protein
VQTIFVLRIFINLHESVRESKKATKKDGIMESWSVGLRQYRV